MQVFAQQSYTINDYGTYIIESDSGTIKKVPIKQDMFLWKLWKNYAVFNCLGRLGYVVYNIESGTVSDILLEKGNMDIKILDDEHYFTIFAWSHIYKLDPISLVIVEKKYVGSIFSETYGSSEKGPITVEKIGESSWRFRGKNNTTSYIDLTFCVDVPNPHGDQDLMAYLTLGYFATQNRYVFSLLTDKY
jgi:sporulation protein YlmC with PRC-barrel domain